MDFVPSFAFMQASPNFFFGFVDLFQQFNLFPHMTALGNVMEGLRTVKGMARDAADAKARKHLARVALYDKADGVIHEQDTPDEVLKNPQQARTQAFLARHNEFHF